MGELIRWRKVALQATWQAQPRHGMQWLGVSPCGPADEQSHHRANALLSKSLNSPCVEVVGGELVFDALGDVQIAVTGAPALIHIDGVRQPMWTSLELKAGQQVSIKLQQRGRYLYLGVNADMQLQTMLGTSSVNVREGLGHHHGSAIQPDEVTFGRALSPCVGKVVPHYLRPVFTDEIYLGVVPGYQYDGLPQSVIDDFFNTAYRIDPQTNKMGVRLSGGKPLELQQIESEGINIGAIQLPAAGQPIIMLQEHQTLGGYPKLGALRKVDIATLAQAPAGTLVRFYPCSRQAAQKAWSSALQQDYQTQCRVL